MDAKKKIWDALDKHFEFYNEDARLQKAARAVIGKMKALARKSEKHTEKLEDLLEKYIAEREQEDPRFDANTLFSIEEAISERECALDEDFDETGPPRREKGPADIEKAKASIWRYVLKG